MTTKQTLRRHRGRAIRKARREQRADYARTVDALDMLRKFRDAFVRWAQDVWSVVRVALCRLAPLLITSRDGAGARRRHPAGGYLPRERR